MTRIQNTHRIEGSVLFEHETSVRLTGAQVRTLSATARTLVDAPGPNQALVPISLRARIGRNDCIRVYRCRRRHYPSVRWHHDRQGDTGDHRLPEPDRPPNQGYECRAGGGL